MRTIFFTIGTENAFLGLTENGVFEGRGASVGRRRPILHFPCLETLIKGAIREENLAKNLE